MIAGPEAGTNGGKIIACGARNLELNEDTTRYISPTKLGHSLNLIKVPKGVKSGDDPNWICLNKVNFRNIENESFVIPKQRLIVCCGVSGAGKSSLVRGVLLSGVRKAIISNKRNLATDCGSVKNGQGFDKAIEVDQKPIGKTSRSTPQLILEFGIESELSSPKSKMQNPWS